MKKLLFIIFFLPALLPAQKNALCDFEKLFTEGKAAATGNNPDYERALKKFNSARRCDPAQGQLIDEEIEQVFEGIKRQKEAALANEKKAKEAERSARDSEKKAVEAKNEAQAEARRNYANDMTYKSQIALRDGDRNTAFRLAEFAHRYVDDDNPNVTQALIDALYYNDDPTHIPLPRAANLEGHTSAVLSVAFSPDGKWLATASDDNNAKIWDLQSGKAVLTLAGHTNAVTSVAFSPDGKRLATGSNDYSAKIWDLQSGKAALTLKGDTFPVFSVAFSPDGKWLATASGNVYSSYNSTKIWDLDRGKATFNLEGYPSAVLSVAFSPDGKWLATGSNDNSAKIWDLQSGKTVLTLEGHTFPVLSVAFSPDGNLLATGSSDKTAKIWDLTIGNATLTFTGHTDNVWSVAFSPDGKWLATASWGHSAKIWDLQSGKAAFTIIGHTNQVSSVAFSPDGKRLATSSWDRSAKIWDLQSGKAAFTIQGSSVAFSPDGKSLATGSWDNNVKIWDLRSGKAALTLVGHTDQVLSVAFSPDGKWLATGCRNKIAKIWDLRSGKAVHTLVGHNNDVYSVAFSPDGKLLATGSSDKTAKIWDLTIGNATLTFTGHTSVVSSVAFSTDGKWLATASWDHSAKIWDLQSGKAALTLVGHASLLSSIAFSPDGKRLATASNDNSVKIWDLQSGKAALTLLGHKGHVLSVAFSPDGKWLATGSNDNSAKIWDLQSGKAALTLVVHTNGGVRVAFSPDGKRLATAGSWVNSAKIYDIQPDVLIQHWQREKQAGLILSQLQQYNLDALLTQHPDNEAKLIATREVWQIKAFADLAATQASGSTMLDRVEPFYIRASRLYCAALSLEEQPAIRQEYVKLLRQWAMIYRAGGQTNRASELETQAFQGCLTSLNANELRQYGYFYYDGEQWPQAAQLYEKAEALEHQTETLLLLYEIGDSTSQGFDFQRFLKTDKEVDLQKYAQYFYQKEDWEKTLQIAERLMVVYDVASSREWVWYAAEKLGRDRFAALFLVDQPDSLLSYADYFAETGNSEDRMANLTQLRLCLRIGERLLEVQNTLDNRILVAGYCNDLAWNLLFTNEVVEAETVIRRGMVLDPENKYLYTNLPHTLLLQDDPVKEAEALRLYVEWKEKDFGEQDLAKYKDAFLDDIRAFEEAGAIPESRRAAFERAKQLLENE